MNFVCKTLLTLLIACWTPLFSTVTITKDDVPILACVINRADKRKCEIAICAIFRNEADFLKEWIEYHRLVGVGHFYLYNNLSQDHFWTVLKPYVDKGIVELFDVPLDSNQHEAKAKTHNFVQVCCYNHAIKLARNLNKWIAIIDSDEFVCPVIDMTLSKALSRYSYADGVVAYWKMFGTSNVWDLTSDELMIEKMLLRIPTPTTSNLFKSIVRPERAVCQNPHLTRIKNGLLVLPNHKKFRHSQKFPVLPVDTICINHYSFRTEKFYHQVKRARRANWGEVFSEEAARAYLESFNAVYDDAMLRFVPQLKERMKQ
ncbi:MAG: glycosyltransferase family 92 protein [Parachlamydiaceae bacterium]|nr:glycosyltransferase family 92 protein [Parachlamydiaceae bacterium]